MESGTHLSLFIKNEKRREGRGSKNEKREKRTGGRREGRWGRIEYVLPEALVFLQNRFFIIRSPYTNVLQLNNKKSQQSEGC